MVNELLFPDNPFLRAVALVAIIVGIIDPLVFYGYLVYGKIHMPPWLFILSVIIITVVAITLNLWYHVFRYMG
jgi:hypothetical protein